MGGGAEAVSVDKVGGAGVPRLCELVVGGWAGEVGMERHSNGQDLFIRACFK